MFLPAKLRDRLNETKVDLDGYRVPLVKSDETLYRSSRPPEPSAPPNWFGWFLAVGLALAAVYGGLGRLARRKYAARWGFVILSMPWLLLMGVGGAILLFFGFATDHVVTWPNENVMQVSVLALPLVVMAPMAVLGTKARKAPRYVAAAMVGISAIGVLCKALPMFHQVNWNIIAMCLPPNAALAYALWYMPPAPARAKKKNDARGFDVKASS
jgi:hypothetical protein